MSKLEFLKELESLLMDIPLDEREEALQYYHDYFDDAGEENEGRIIDELGSPNKVASIIKADLSSNGVDRINRGYFTERGYQDTIEKNEPYELVRMKKESNQEQKNSNQEQKNSNSKARITGNNGYTGNTENTGNAGNTSNTSNSYDSSNRSGSTGDNQYTNSHQMNQNSNSALLIIIALLTFPIWFPLIMSVFGVAVGIFFTILGIILGFGLAGIAMIIAGIILFITGLIEVGASFVGMLLIGCGMLVLGLGMLLTVACVLLCKKVLPAFIRGIVAIGRLPFKNRRVMA